MRVCNQGTIFKSSPGSDFDGNVCFHPCVFVGFIESNTLRDHIIYLSLIYFELSPFRAGLKQKKNSRKSK